MKRKQILSIAALVMSATIFTACTNTDQKVTFSQYWNYDVNVASASTVETLTYDVNFVKGSGFSDYGVTVSYSDGVYTTKLSTKTENEKIRQFQGF